MPILFELKTTARPGCFRLFLKHGVSLFHWVTLHVLMVTFKCHLIAVKDIPVDIRIAILLAWQAMIDIHSNYLRFYVYRVTVIPHIYIVVLR